MTYQAASIGGVTGDRSKMNSLLLVLVELFGIVFKKFSITNFQFSINL